MNKSLVVIFPLLLAVSAATGQVIGPSWNPDDPVNLAEKRQYFALAWNTNRSAEQEAAYQNFTFTNDIPATDLQFNYDEMAVFTNLYSDRLNTTGENGPIYTILDLMRDDADVAARFQFFVVTGQVVTSPATDPALTDKHLWMILDAIGSGESYKLDGLSVDNGALVSSKLGLKSYVAQVSPTPTPTVPPALTQFDCDLRYWIQKSLLACMAGHTIQPGNKRLYVPENGTDPTNKKPRGRFDCDDFSDALDWFLRKRLKAIYPDADIKNFYFSWDCVVKDAAGHEVSRKPAAHEIVIIIKDGKFWLVDPQSGKTIGPFDDIKKAYDYAYNDFASCTCTLTTGQTCTKEPRPHVETPGSPGPQWPNPTMHDPTVRYPGDAPKPGLDFDDIQRRFCEFLTWACANCTVTPPAGCTPSPLPAGTTPDPCKSLRPYTKPGTVIPSDNPCFVS
ncbi:MAG: hypothetical protein ACREJO_08180 [Phycisphaerales bacterium]